MCVDQKQEVSLIAAHVRARSSPASCGRGLFLLSIPADFSCSGEGLELVWPLFINQNN